MGERSIIEWTHSTLNFWRGCDKVDPTCAACYLQHIEAECRRAHAAVTTDEEGSR